MGSLEEKQQELFRKPESHETLKILEDWLWK